MSAETQYYGGAFRYVGGVKVLFYQQFETT